MGDVLEQVKDLTALGWNFKLVSDRAYGEGVWQATFWHPSLTTMHFADGPDPHLAMSRAIRRLLEAK